MDPEASPSAITYYVTSSAIENLIFMNSQRKLEPWLAESWEVSKDAKTFTFKLRTDVTFQDGTTFDAKAVKWNLDRVVNPQYKAGSSLNALSGYKSTDTPDDHTAVVSFKSAYIPFLNYVAGGTLAMLSPTATQKQGTAVNQKPVSSGPYKFTEYVAKEHVTIERWDGYKRKLPWADEAGPGYLDKIVFKFIPETGTRVTTVQSGETQMADLIPSQDLPHFTNNSGYTIMKQPWTGAPLIWLINVTLPPTDDVKVRQAINYAVNKQAIVDTVWQGEGSAAFAPLTPVMLDDSTIKQYDHYDPAKAKQLLDEAGWKGDSGIRQKNGKPLQLVINTINYGGGPQQEVILVQGQLRNVGIDAKLKVQARPPFYNDNYKGTTNGPVMFLRSGDLDALYALFYSGNVGSNFNWSMLKDPEIDKLLIQGREESDPAKRKQIYLTVEQKIMEMGACVPLVNEDAVWVIKSSVGGMLFNGFTYPLVTQMFMTS